MWNRNSRFVGALLMVSANAAGHNPNPGDTSRATAKAIAAQYAKLPLAFERHEGATGAEYVAHGSGYSISLAKGNARIGIISMEFVGGRRAAGTPRDELPGKVNYISGRDSRQWQSGLRTYRRVEYSGIYPGIDVDYYSNGGQLEFDLTLSPGADPGRIRLKFSGEQRLTLDGDGALLIQVATGVVKLPLPAIYQDVAGERRPVKGRYTLRGKARSGFK